MHIILSLCLAFLFVFLAAFNLWSQLAAPGRSPRAVKIWIQIHRAVGYTFIALFVSFVYFMLLRLKGWTHEPAPRIVLHMALAFLLAPLLFAKVVVARYQKSARGLLTGLGVTIFAMAFTLVAINAAVVFFRSTSDESVRLRVSAGLVLTVLALATAGFLIGRRPGRNEQSKQKEAASPAPAGSHEPLELRLVRIERRSHDAKTLRFLLPPGRQIDARPGQFLTFEWVIDGKTVPRSYSICSSPSQKSFIEITPKRVEKGNVSLFLNDRAEEGLTVRARGPYGRFFFDDRLHKRIVLIAGGSGITPFMAMLRYIDDLCIPVRSTLIYCARTEHDLFFKDELNSLQQRLASFRYVPVPSNAVPEWTGWTGRLRREILEKEVEDALACTYFLCGPPPFMEHARTLLKELGVQPSKILQESFGPAVSTPTEKLPAAAPAAYHVTFMRSGAAFNISPEENLLECAEKNGVLMPSGCRQGECGTCITRLLSGKVHMEQPEALDEERRSQGYILPCVSRAQSHLTIDA